MTIFTRKGGRRGVAAAATILAALVPLVQLYAVPAFAADYSVGAIRVSQPWARATPKGATTGAGYMAVTNSGTEPDRVSCVSSDASARCQIHSMTMDGGIMKMRPVEDGLEIKPGETVTLKPSGFHIMFLDLTHPLEPGKTVEATLKFQNAGSVDVQFPIAAIGAPPPDGAGGGMMRMNKQ
jgi:hypothetical protein